MSDRDVKELFADVRFTDEPPSATPVGAYVGIGQRRLRRRRWLRSAGALGGAAIVAGGVVTVLPDHDAMSPSTRLGIAASPPAGAESGAEPAEPANQIDHPPLPGESAEFEFPMTRQLLLDVARETLDPEGDHLPAESTSFHGGRVGGAREVGTKLSWTNPGESGEGMIYVAVTEPGYSDEEYALDGFADLAGSGDFDRFTEQTLPGTSATGWVYRGGTGDDLRLGVVVERDDGSLVGIGVYGLFGNNSLTGVSDISIDLESAAAYVTDPRLRIQDDDLAVERQWAEFIEWLTEQDASTQQKVIHELKKERDDLAHQLVTRWLRSTDELEEWGLVNKS